MNYRTRRKIGSAAGPGVLGVSLLGVSLLGGCSGSGSEGEPAGEAPSQEPAAPTYPAGTVFAIGGVPILAEDIDRYVPLIAKIDPHVVLQSQRRRALANITLPIAAAHSLDPAAREEAFLRAQAILAAVRETGTLPPDAPEANYLTGSWRDVGMVPFHLAQTTPIGNYSELVETPGAFTFFKYVASNAEDPNDLGPLSEITIQRYDVPFLPDEVSAELIQSAIEGLPIEVVDEEWEAVMPPIHLYPKSAPPR